MSYANNKYNRVMKRKMKMRISRVSLLFILMTLMLGCMPGSKDRSGEGAKVPVSPNIILIFMDDMGYGDPTSYGGTGYSMPHLDRLAAEGMRFTNFYAAQAVCSASRAGILTGCYPNRLGITGALFPNSPIGLNASEETMAEVLKKRNYGTAIIGKWHLGDSEEFLPLQHGFDEFFGLPYSNDMWLYDYDGKPGDPSSWRGKVPPLPLMEGNETIEHVRNMDDQDQLTVRYTERAVDYIKAHKETPFFLYFAHTMPHVPLAVSDKFRGKSQQGLYGDVMMEIDWSVGQIMKALKDNGLDSNTLVVFTSDNGPWLNFGNHGGSAGGLREGKQTAWEGGQRVPAIMRWPGVVPKGSVNNQLASTIDLLPTFASITGSPLPDKKIDGVDITSLLKGGDGASPREHLLYYYNRNSLQAVRKGPWKLVLPHSYSTYEGELPGRDGLYGNRHTESTDLALYNLRRDPGERYDVKEQHPEIIEDLIVLVEQAREDLGDDLTGRAGENRRETGKRIE